MNNIKLLALFGESSAGKDSIQHWLGNNFKNIHEIVSYTTRPPRNYEQDGKDYHFVSKSDFEKYIVKDQLLEFTVFNDWYYGTHIDELKADKINVGVFNPFGVRSLLYHDNNLDILPVWVQTDDKIRLMRSLQREENPNCAEICRRFLADKKDFSNIQFNYEVYINNNQQNQYFDLFNNQIISRFLQVKNN